MKIEEVISQLESLIEDRKSFLSNDGDDETFRNDIEALEAVIDILQDNFLKEKEIYRKSLEKWGYHQRTIALEEMAELQKEICKNIRGYDNRIEIAEEIADVKIILEQMELLFDIENSVRKFKEYKLIRLKERLKE